MVDSILITIWRALIVMWSSIGLLLLRVIVSSACYQDSFCKLDANGNQAQGSRFKKLVSNLILITILKFH